MGVDVGATLAKIALRDRSGRTRFDFLSAASAPAVADRVAKLAPSRVGLTGGGAPVLAGLLACDTVEIPEFQAWGRGATKLLGDDGREPYLLVSVGTGTSAVVVEDGQARREGGTALGGGTVVGLCAALIGTRDFEELCVLAAAGSRENVDLLVSDIYQDGKLPLPGWATAAAFAKLSLPDECRAKYPEATRADLAAGVMHLVGENVALVCNAIASAAGVSHIVFGGTTLRGNDALADVLSFISSAIGRKPTILRDGEFAGALGALEFARGD